MDIKYSNGFVPGIILGLIAGVFAAVHWCCCLPIILPLFVGAGYWAVHKSKDAVANQNDMLKTGAFAGGVAGVVSSIIWILLSMLLGALLVSFIPMSDQYSAGGILAGIGVTSLIYVIGGVVCCLPTYLILGVIMGAVGGFIFDQTKK
jgi:hypothetical protein